jgi:hypothetical protein
MFEKIFITQTTPSWKFFIFLGLFLLFLGIASIVQIFVLIPFADVSSLNDIANIENLLSDMSNPAIVQGMKIAQAISAVIAFIVPSFLFAYFFSGEKFSYLKINKGFKIILLPVIVALVFTIMPVINFTGELNSKLSLPDFLSGLEKSMRASEERMKVITDAFLQMNDIGDLLVNILVIALLAALGEELLFRGVFQNILAQWTKNIHTAIFITAILFSTLHFQFYGFLPRFLLGVVLGYLYVWSSSLWLPILFHFLNNGLAVVFSYLISKSLLTENAETVGAGGENALMFVLLSIVLSAGLLCFVWKQREEMQP